MKGYVLAIITQFRRSRLRMHITFSFTSQEFSYVRLPSANLHLFQSMLYSLLPDELASRLHDEGFDSEGRRMKLFAMGWPVASSRPQFGEGTVVFPLPMRLTVSTPVNELASAFAAGAMSREDIRIGNNHLICNGIEKHGQKINSDSVTVRTLSPITCYEASERNGRQYTEYFAYDDERFVKGIHFNLLRKFRLLYPEKDIPEDSFSITPVGRLKERVSMFEKGGLFPIKGWWGKFRLAGNREILQTAIDCGLGAKNSSGWGCITIERG